MLMQDQTNLDRLSEKVSQILKQFHVLKNENKMMKNELTTLKAEKELKDTEIEKLIEENVKKEMEIEEIVNKIESILG